MGLKVLNSCCIGWVTWKGLAECLELEGCVRMGTVALSLSLDRVLSQLWDNPLTPVH